MLGLERNGRDTPRGVYSRPLEMPMIVYGGKDTNSVNPHGD